jgi:ribosomal protein S18 acetylase RimI-like enzyme
MRLSSRHNAAEMFMRTDSRSVFQTSQASSPEDVKSTRELFEEYAAWLRVDLCFQGFAKELAGLPGAYAPPRGRLLLASAEGVAAGCVALRPIRADVCEMKRLFVRPSFQGRGLGRRLASQAVSEAKAIGYSSMVLDTLPSMHGAIRLYRSLGFKPHSAYYDTPLQETIFMELKL